MAHHVHETITTSKPAPMTAHVAERRGILKPVDRHKTVERRRIRRQERRAWAREAQEMMA